MADAAVAAIVEPLISTIKQWLKEEVSLVKGVKKELENVSSKLQQIRNVLDDAERRSVKEITVQGWLEELKDISYEMDDVLDEWNTAIMKRKFEEVENPSDFPKEKISCASLFISCISFIQDTCFPFNQVGLRREIAWKIKDIDTRLDSVIREISDFKFVMNYPLLQSSVASLVSERITTSIFKESEIYGRDNEKKTLLSSLLSKGSQEVNRNIVVISIVGVGGLGKTALAKLVYNNNEVKKSFSEKIWVCVSDHFDTFKIAREIIEKIDGQKPPKDCSPDRLLTHLKQSISNVKFLLVLDDVWDENGKKWEELRNCLEDGTAGSRILVTTRKETVAEVMGTTHLYRLDKLFEEACWSLFKQIVIAGKRGNFEMLTKIGREIVKRCKGLPLAVTTLGNLLRFKKTIEEWKRVLNSEIWKLEKVEVELFPHLYLSYRELSLTIKRCFSYCSIFPKDTMIYREELIRLWIAQGYVTSTDEEYDMELKGQEYFDKLAMCCFFQDFGKDGASGKIILCKMHDILHDFAQYLTRNECIIIANEIPNRFFEKARHLTWIPNPECESPPLTICDVGKLRSFFTDGHSFEEPVALMNHLQCVRVLVLKECNLKRLPKEIGSLVHLRYLDLSRSWDLGQLPESVCELHNLLTLDIGYCSSLRELPQMIGKLRNLRHLVILGCSLIEYPKSFEKLTNLRTLEGLFKVGRKFGKLEYLKHFKHLRGSLRIMFDGDLEEADLVAGAERAELQNSKYIEELGLRFPKVEVATEALLEALQPPPSLQILKISGTFGTRYPSWLTNSLLNNLRVLHISGPTPNCSTLPPLWRLPYLEHLHIGNNKSIKHIGREFLGIEEEEDTITPGDSSLRRAPALSSACAFPKLVELHIWGLEEWEKWEDLNQEDEQETSIQIMPRLRQLILDGCPKLHQLPNRLLGKVLSLEYLGIGRCGLFGDNEDTDSHRRRIEQLLSRIPTIRVDDVTYTADNPTGTPNTEFYRRDS